MDMGLDSLSICFILLGEPTSFQAMDSLLGNGPRHIVSSQLAMLMEGAVVQRIQSSRLSENHSHWLENKGSGVAYVSMCTHDHVQQWHSLHQLPRCLPSLTEHCLKVRVSDKGEDGVSVFHSERQRAGPLLQQ